SVLRACVADDRPPPCRRTPPSPRHCRRQRTDCSHGQQARRGAAEATDLAELRTPEHVAELLIEIHEVRLATGRNELVGAIQERGERCQRNLEECLPERRS